MAPQGASFPPRAALSACDLRPSPRPPAWGRERRFPRPRQPSVPPDVISAWPGDSARHVRVPEAEVWSALTRCQRLPFPCAVVPRAPAHRLSPSTAWLSVGKKPCRSADCRCAGRVGAKAEGRFGPLREGGPGCCSWTVAPERHPVPNVSLTASCRDGEPEDATEQGLPAQLPLFPPAWGCRTVATASLLTALSLNFVVCRVG